MVTYVERYRVLPFLSSRTTFKREKVVRVDKATVTEFQLNPEFQDSAFELVVPPNTLVSDIRSDHTQELLDAIGKTQDSDASKRSK